MVPILSIEISGATLSSLHDNMNEPGKLRLEQQTPSASEQRMPFVVRENEVERAREIADEFYPRNRNLLQDQIGATLPSPGDAELCARICELARMLSYSQAKTRMLVVQWRLDLVGLERKLQNELDEGPQTAAIGNSCKRPTAHPRDRRAFGC